MMEPFVFLRSFWFYFTAMSFFSMTSMHAIHDFEFIFSFHCSVIILLSIEIILIHVFAFY
jgi:hypothetical protein